MPIQPMKMHRLLESPLFGSIDMSKINSLIAVSVCDEFGFQGCRNTLRWRMGKGRKTLATGSKATRRVRLLHIRIGHQPFEMRKLS